MAKCEVCGNDYYLSFEVITANEKHTFDSFECAIYKLAPVCDHCRCKIIGHGIEANKTFYCCANLRASQGWRKLRTMHRATEADMAKTRERTRRDEHEMQRGYDKRSGLLFTG
jgi:hypothetical protein